MFTDILWTQGGHLSPSLRGHWSSKWIYHQVCDTWPVQRQTYSYFSSDRKYPAYCW